MRARVQQTIARTCRRDRACSISAAVRDPMRSGSARQGYRVTAIDWSPAMVEEARRRVEAPDVGDRVEVQHVGIHELDRLEPARRASTPCIRTSVRSTACDDIAGAARPIANRLTPGRAADRIGDRPGLSLGDGALRRARQCGARLHPLPPRLGRGAARGRDGVDPLFRSAASSTAIFAPPACSVCRCARSGCSCRRRICNRSPIATRA